VVKSKSRVQTSPLLPKVWKSASLPPRKDVYTCFLSHPPFKRGFRHPITLPNSGSPLVSSALLRDRSRTAEPSPTYLNVPNLVRCVLCPYFQDLVLRSESYELLRKLRARVPFDSSPFPNQRISRASVFDQRSGMHDNQGSFLEKPRGSWTTVTQIAIGCADYCAATPS